MIAVKDKDTFHSVIHKLTTFFTPLKCAPKVMTVSSEMGRLLQAYKASVKLKCQLASKDPVDIYPQGSTCIITLLSPESIQQAKLVIEGLEINLCKRFSEFELKVQAWRDAEEGVDRVSDICRKTETLATCSNTSVAEKQRSVAFPSLAQHGPESKIPSTVTRKIEVVVGDICEITLQVKSHLFCVDESILNISEPLVVHCVSRRLANLRKGN